MWKLINVKKDHLEQYILVGEQIIVGRKDANLLIENDPSVSRKHALLYVVYPKENMGNTSKPSSLFLRDENSKYGTFKNGVRVTSEVELFCGDEIKFGQFESTYRVSKVPLVIATSCLDVSKKQELRKLIYDLGGHFVSEWQSSCTHLVMSEVKVTVKALCCLCAAKPIVKPEFFLDWKNNIGNSSVSIHPNKYIPPIGEALIDKEKVSFDINHQRKTIFKKKNFFFLDENQYKKLHLGIVLGGGNASVLSTDKVTPELLLQDGCCIIDPMKTSSQEMKGTLQNIISILQTKKLRMIPESDVGLAVAYCSTEKFCNPEFNIGDAVLHGPQIQSQTLTEREVYVPDTQERLLSMERAKNMVSTACSSLNFSSFRTDAADEMEISEIPLSAQVKRELDDIFDEPMDDNVESPVKVETMPSTSRSLDKTHRLKRGSSKVKNELDDIFVEPINDKVESPIKVDTMPSVSSSLDKTLRLKRRSTNIKNEFEDVFDEPMDEKEGKISKTDKISSFSNSLDKTTRLKRVSSRSLNGESSNNNQFEQSVLNEKSSAKILPLSKRNELSKEGAPLKKNSIKSEENNCFENGHLSEINETIEPELPRNLVKVEIVPLICKRKNTIPSVQQYKNSSVKNFKKFKKVYPKKTQVLPRIIGAHELVPYDKIATEICNMAWDDPAEEVPQPIKKGAFDWDTPTV